MGFFNELKYLFMTKKEKTAHEAEREKYLDLESLLLRVRENGNDTEALYEIGFMYLQDFYVGIYPDKAKNWFLKAAAQSHSLSHRYLGMMHEKNIYFNAHSHNMFCLQESFSWYKKGAILGDFYCQGRLAKKYEDGEGVAKSLVQAFRWNATRLGFVPTDLQKKMTDDELKEARNILAMLNISENKARH